MVQDQCRRARAAGHQLATADSTAKQEALRITAQELEADRTMIAEANAKDLANAKKKGRSGAKLDRLRLSDKVIHEMISGLKEVALLPDPVGEITGMWTRPNGLQVGRMRIPMGVIGIIYESRPNVTVDAAALCIKAGNAVVLRGGSEAFHSNQCLTGILQQAMAQAGLSADGVQLVQTTDRAAVLDLLQMEEFIDVMIPRGGEELIRFVAEHARMPVLKHYKGVCHILVDREADLGMAVAITVNAKTQRPGVCNALETLLVHRDVATAFLPRVAEALREKGVELRGCDRTCEILGECIQATEQDWHSEYLDLILSIRVVDSLDQALEHINRYSSAHTEAIITTHIQRARRFVREVQSSLVLVNASTRFNDGYQLGLGAEIGISTSRLHAFGPMGVNELTTTKFIAFGDGQVRA